jgi:peroxiredoxin
VSITNFADLISEARLQPDAQRLLFVFTRAELPDNPTAEQRRHFEQGVGGVLTPATPRSSPSRPPPSTTASSSRSPTPTCKGKWSVFFFYPADFTFVCPTELGDLPTTTRAPAPGRRGLLGLDRHPLHPQGVARHLRHHRQDPVPDDRRPDRQITRNFEVLREGQGLADRGTFVIDPDGIIQFIEITPRASAATPPSCSARSRPPSTCASTRARSAPPSGKRAKTPSPRRSTSSARSDDPHDDELRGRRFPPGRPWSRPQARRDDAPSPDPRRNPDARRHPRLEAHLDQGHPADRARRLPRRRRQVRRAAGAARPRSPAVRPDHRRARRRRRRAPRRSPSTASAPTSPCASPASPGPRVHLAGAGPAPGRRPPAQGDRRGDRADPPSTASYHFETYFSLSCQNCPDVVQALNLMSVLNPNIRHVAIDGALFQDEVEERQVMAVPTVYLNGEPCSGQGRMSLEEIVAKLDTGAADARRRAHRRQGPLRRARGRRRAGRRRGRHLRRPQGHPHRRGRRALRRPGARHHGHRELHLRPLHRGPQAGRRSSSTSRSTRSTS